MLRDNRIYEESSGEEVFEINDYEMDKLLKDAQLDVQTSREWSRRQTSYTGLHMESLDWLPDTSSVDSYEPPCDIADKVYQAGGVRLLTLYCNKFNFFSAATDLGISYAALMKWFQRWRETARMNGITPKSLGLM